MEWLGDIKKFLLFVREELAKINENGMQCDRGWYGGETTDQDVAEAYQEYQKGDFDQAAVTLLQNYCDQDGGEHREIEYEIEDLAANLEDLREGVH